MKPETLEGAEAGVDFHKGPIRFQATAFTNTIKDLITSRDLTDSELPPGFFFGTRLINAGRARSRGVEAELDWQISRKLMGTLGYTYADSIVTDNPEDPQSVGLQQAGVPKQRFSAGVDWTGPRGVRLSPRVRYVSRTNGDADGLLHTDPHVVFDLSASAPIVKQMEAFVQIENLFDRRYVADNSGFSPALLGTPFTALGGVRLNIR